MITSIPGVGGIFADDRVCTGPGWTSTSPASMRRLLLVMATWLAHTIRRMRRILPREEEEKQGEEEEEEDLLLGIFQEDEDILDALLPMAARYCWTVIIFCKENTCACLIYSSLLIYGCTGQTKMLHLHVC